MTIAATATAFGAAAPPADADEIVSSTETYLYLPPATWTSGSSITR